uniref:F-box domain-containing protein n=1 Tax=Arundo donax TaxID=35708 RepID=A0A0A9BIR1_ARUDO
MGNVLNLICETTTLQQWLPQQIQLGRTVDHQSELWNVLIFRALAEHIRHISIHEKGIVCGRFQLWSILICTAMSGNLCRKPIHKKDVAHYQFQLLGILICGVISDHIIGMKNDPFKNLPEDVLRIILSKLSLKEVVRTSAVSRKWRYLWQVSPKLNFDGITICGKNICGKQQYSLKFISNVYAVLLQCRGRVVEELAIKFDFDTMLVGHLNNWVSFAVSSGTKFLAFDLAPKDFRCRNDRYIFPFKLLDNGSVSRLQKIQLSFVSLQPPTQFSGFPNLRKLDLNLAHVNGKDFPEMLANSHKLEWLRIVRCHLYDELKVASPLPCLVYLNVSYCEISKIALCAVKLRTFVYNGRPVPIDFNRSSELENADIYFSSVTLEHAFTELANALTTVKNLTFDTACKPAKMPCLMDNLCTFSLLKHLKLILLFKDDVDNLSLVSFLRSAPFIENFEMHMSVFPSLYLGKGPTRRHPACPYKNLKNVFITGFIGSNGQLEFLVHIVENAHALEVLTIDWSDKLVKKDPWEDDERKPEYVASIHRTVRKCVEGKISPRCSLGLL